MIRGLGLQLVSLAQIQHQLDDFDTDFSAQHFTPSEMQEVRELRPELQIQKMAEYIALKKSCVTALTQIAGGRPLMAKTDYRLMEVVAKPGTPPYLMLEGELREIARRLHIERINLNVSCAEGVAAAVVVIE